MKDIYGLNGKNIVVTGAASGIGRETALLLSELGARCLCVDLNECGLKELQQKSNGNVIPYVYDLLDFSNYRAIFKEALKTGKVHGLVHCAGIPSITPLRGLSDETYEKVQRLNTQAGVNLAKYFSKKGVYDSNATCSVVFISSVYGLVGSVANVAYAASKAAVIGVTKSLAIEFASKRIRVDCVAPGFVKTSMGSDITQFLDEKYNERVDALHPLGYGEPKDISNCIVFLLSDAAKWITGTVLSVDGGFTAQ